MCKISITVSDILSPRISRASNTSLTCNLFLPRFFSRVFLSATHFLCYTVHDYRVSNCIFPLLSFNPNCLNLRCPLKSFLKSTYLSGAPSTSSFFLATRHNYLRHNTFRASFSILKFSITLSPLSSGIPKCS